MSTALRALVVDDEAPARHDLTYLLGRQDGVGEVVAATDALEALRFLRDSSFDAVFLDIRMPGLDGLELARLLARFAVPPAVVFVTAFEGHAVEAFDIQATDYLLKPVGEARLALALARVRAARPAVPAAAEVATPAGGALDVVPVEHNGSMLLIERDAVAYAVAAGDYVRLHTVDGSRHLVRISLSRLEEAWGPHGFARIHRQYLVALARVSALRGDGSGLVVCIGSVELAVSRRHARELRERLVRRRLRSGP